MRAPFTRRGIHKRSRVEVGSLTRVKAFIAVLKNKQESLRQKAEFAQLRGDTVASRSDAGCQPALGGH